MRPGREPRRTKPNVIVKKLVNWRFEKAAASSPPPPEMVHLIAASCQRQKILPNRLKDELDRLKKIGINYEVETGENEPQAKRNVATMKLDAVIGAQSRLSAAGFVKRFA